MKSSQVEMNGRLFHHKLKLTKIANNKLKIKF